jgi:hypothetical protein
MEFRKRDGLLPSPTRRAADSGRIWGGVDAGARSWKKQRAASPKHATGLEEA